MTQETVNGTSLAFEFAGEAGGPGPSAPVVVLLNGIAMSVAHWKPVVEGLPGFRFLLHDFRGQLLSPRPPGSTISLQDHVEDLAALLRLQRIPRAHLVGTSYGAEVGLLFAATYPGMTRSLAVIDGVSELDPLLRATAESWKTAALADPVVFYRSLIPWNYSAAYIAENAEALARRESAIAALPREYFESFAALCDAFLGLGAAPLTPRLAEIGARTLVLVGQKDILKHEGFARIIAAGIRGARLEVLEGAGHAAVIEQPDAVCARLAHFLREETA